MPNIVDPGPEGFASIRMRSIAKQVQTTINSVHQYLSLNSCAKHLIFSLSSPISQNRILIETSLD
jgi:hypothetical protein